MSLSRQRRCNSIRLHSPYIYIHLNCVDDCARGLLHSLSLVYLAIIIFAYTHILILCHLAARRWKRRKKAERFAIGLSAGRARPVHAAHIYIWLCSAVDKNFWGGSWRRPRRRLISLRSRHKYIPAATTGTATRLARCFAYEPDNLQASSGIYTYYIRTKFSDSFCRLREPLLPFLSRFVADGEIFFLFLPSLCIYCKKCAMTRARVFIRSEGISNLFVKEL